MKPAPTNNNVKQWFIDHQFACFVIACISIAIVMTLISLELYKKSDAIKLDMSRPGYEKVRKEVEKSSDDHPYDSSGPLDQAAIKDFESRMSKYKNELQKLGTYDSSILDDDNLGIQTDSANDTSPAPVNQN